MSIKLTEKKVILFFFFFAVIASAVFSFRLYLTRAGIYGDGIDYYVYARSLFFDHDLNFENEYKFYQERGQDIRSIASIMRTPTGYVNVPSPIGSSLLWLPFVLLTHILVSGDGFSSPYELIIGFANIFFGFISLYLIYKTVNIFFEKNIAFIASISIFLSTSAVFYFAFEPIRSHMPSLLMATLFVYFWLKSSHKRSLKQWGILGFLMGWLAMIRTQELTLFSLVFAELILKLKEDDWKRTLFFLRGVFVFILVAIVTYLPQFMVQKIMWGSFFVNPYGLMTGKKLFYWLHPQFINILFSTNHGLFLWFPLTLVAVIGFLRWKVKKMIWWPLLISFLIQYYLLASYESWWQSAGFGPRMFITANPFFSLGLASLIDKTRKKVSFKITGIILSAFVIWNFLLLGQFILKMIPNDAPFDLTTMIVNQFFLPIILLRKIIPL